jgi:hypothetical protein
VELEIRPEPTDEEREAIARAVEAAGEAHPAYGSGWRDAGLREAAGAPDDERP